MRSPLRGTEIGFINVTYLFRVITNKKYILITKNLDCSINGYLFFYASLVPVKYAIIYYDIDKTFQFNKIVQLRDFQKQFNNINAIEYFVDYSFFKDFTEKHKIFFELKGKAQIFTAINNRSKIKMKDESVAIASEIFYPEGIDDYLREIDNDRTTACSGMIFRSNNKNESGTFRFSMRVHHTGPRKIISFVNGHVTCEGGTHVKGAEDSVRKFAEDISTLRFLSNKKEKIDFPDFKSYTAILSVFIENCSWKGDVKECLLNEDAYQLVFEGINNTFDAWKNQLLSNID